MQFLTLVVALLVVTSFAYRMGRGKALAMAGKGSARLNSLPRYHGYYVALWCGVAAVGLVAGWMAFGPLLVREMVEAGFPPDLRALPPAQLELVFNEVRLVARYGHQASSPAVAAAAEHMRTLNGMSFAAAAVLALSVAIAGLAWGRKFISAGLRARDTVERAVKVFLLAASTVAVLTTVGIVLSLIFESIRFFSAVPLGEFLFGTVWSPQVAMRADQAGSSGAFGAVPLFTGTLLISFIAMIVAVPLGIFSAIYMAEYAQPRVRAVVKPLLEILAGIPTVVYGFFAALVMAPLFRQLGESLGFSVSSESALVAGVVMGIMIIPFISSLSDDVITAVPQSLREGSYGLGATKSETIKQVVLPAALPGIVGGVLLALSRAIGETMIVVMAAGMAANLTANPLQSVTTVTVQIVTLLVGDQEFDSPKTLAAFALGLVLFCVTLVLNVVALHVIRKYQEKYD